MQATQHKGATGMDSNESKPDFYSGLPWVYVPPEQVRAHPKGRLNLILWLIATYFIGIGLLKFYLSLQQGHGIGIGIANGIWPLLTGIGLAIRAPYAVLMACVSAGLTVYALLRGIGQEGTVTILLETIANVAILFYLIDGDRPNFVYRHRYRKYSVEDAKD